MSWYQVCPKCNGEGSVVSAPDMGYTSIVPDIRACPVCGGEGKLLVPGNPPFAPGADTFLSQGGETDAKPVD